MTNVIVTYTVKPGRADENAALIGAVLAELQEQPRDDVSYASYRDGDSFTHIASYAEGTNPLGEVEAFREFRAGLDDRITAPIVRREVERVKGVKKGSEPLFTPANVG